jgi:hypothetical protein
MHHVASAIIDYKTYADTDFYIFTIDQKWITNAGMQG